VNLYVRWDSVAAHVNTTKSLRFHKTFENSLSSWSTVSYQHHKKDSATFIELELKYGKCLVEKLGSSVESLCYWPFGVEPIFIRCSASRSKLRSHFKCKLRGHIQITHVSIGFHDWAVSSVCYLLSGHLSWYSSYFLRKFLSISFFHSLSLSLSLSLCRSCER
jgi:hypothetical protein